MNEIAVADNPKSKLLINALSIIIPLMVVALLAIPTKLDLGNWTKSISHVIGIINSATTVFLLLGLYFIKKNNVRAHRAAMLGAFTLGAVFLVCYVLYHLTNPANKFEGEGIVRIIYLVILFSHIGLSFVVLPLVLRALYYALTADFEAHRRLVKYAYPIWLYVSASGVVVYLMLYHLPK